MDQQGNKDQKGVNYLKLLNQQVSELLTIQRKISIGTDYLNANELAQLLGESKKTIYARVKNRQMPYYKPGGKLLLFKKSEIQEWIKAGRHASLDELEQIL
ncbi:helix-turn-helix transcriptional regulator [Saccharicrinis aurantiacus]|uniref:helix-turn-helix transcriptional regulator n=1 Tax=Saccharicrinis aurantiacus TaxID=1849719 RepID=UPI00094F7006|nr:helix-turn-helix domain-containing protein [Saccharicrinis aurantiacus]